jgi:hypothetical protein
VSQGVDRGHCGAESLSAAKFLDAENGLVPRSHLRANLGIPLLIPRYNVKGLLVPETGR